MFALHLYSNHKITGPAELALDTAAALSKRGQGARFYSSWVPPNPPDRDRWLQLLARERGVPEADLHGVRLPKHIAPLRALLDVRALCSHLRADPPGVLHCHLPGDHLVGGLAARRVGGIPVVRTIYDGEPLKPRARTRYMLGKLTDRIVCLSQRVANALREDAKSFGLDPACVSHASPPIDLGRFDPARGVPPRRGELGVPDDAFCLGIVARMQTHRRFEVLLEAMTLAREEVPNLHLVVVGRGTNQETVARQPVKDLGLEGSVHFSGYVQGETYVSTLASCDAKVFLVPGSDGTCRAVREALALGLPVIATQRGILPELVRDGVDGLLVDETAPGLCAAFVRLAKNREDARRMGRCARSGAEERFSYERYVGHLEEVYRQL